MSGRILSTAMANHGASRNVRPRLESPDPWMAGLCDTQESEAWVHVANSPELYHDPLAPTPAPPPSQLPQSDASSDSSDDDDDVIDNCPCLGVATSVVHAQKHDTEGLDRIIWNRQSDGASVWGRIKEIAGDADYFYIGISSAIRQRYIGGKTASGNEIIGHASRGYDAMEILFHTSCACAKRFEKALIARVRADNDIRHLCRNKSDGGEGMAGNAPVYFVYAAYSLLPPQRVPDFSRWYPPAHCG